MSTVNRRLVLRGGLGAAAMVGAGVLSAGSGAAAGGVQSVSGVQDGWRWCRKCQSLFYFGSRFDPHFGRCAAGGAHTDADSYHYYLTYDNTVPPPVMARQPDWRHCRRCMALSYNKDVVGYCPGAGRHDHTGSHNYFLYHDASPTYGEQDLWRWCDNCQAMFFGPNLLSSACSKSGKHRIGSTSFNYVMQHTYFD